jgi:hypothetical protein
VFFTSRYGLRFAAAGTALCACLLASCGGGNVATTLVSATTSPSTSQAVPSGGGSLALPAASNGQVAALTFSAGVPAGTTISSSASAAPPAGAPAPASLKRTTQAISGAVPFYFVAFTVSSAFSAANVTGESVTLTSADPTTASYFAEFDDITSTPGTKLATAGPGTIANGVVTILNGTAASSVTLQPGHAYLLQFYYVAASGTATPSPAATSTASAAPTAPPSPAATPTSVPTSGAQACSGQTTTASSASATEALATAGGSLCIPAFGSFGGTIAYPTVSTAISATLTSSTTNIGGYPALSSGTPIFYLQLALSGATTFGTGTTAGGGLTSTSIIPGQTYSVFGQATIFGISAKFTPCVTTATAGTNAAGTISGLGTVLKGVNVPAAATGLLEIYPGSTAGAGAC